MRQHGSTQYEGTVTAGHISAFPQIKHVSSGLPAYSSYVFTISPGMAWSVLELKFERLQKRILPPCGDCSTS
jgi:hypothetical protein